MVAAQDLGSCDFGRVGSSPISRTCDYSVFLDFPALLLHRGSIRIDVFVWCFVGFLWGLLVLPTTPCMFSQCEFPCGCKFRRGTDHSCAVAASASNASAIRTKASADRNSAHNLSSSSVAVPMTRANVVQTGKTPVLTPRAMPARTSFLPFFFVACHCRDWNTVAIRDGMGYPHMSSSSIAPTQRQNVVEFGVPLTRLLPSLPIRREGRCMRLV